MRYHICVAKRPHELEKQVNEYLADGWEPQGGLQHGNNLDSLYYQAIINRDFPAAPKKSAQAHN